MSDIFITLRYEKERFRQSALVVADAEGKIHFMNRKAIESLCGFRINNISVLASIHRDLPDLLQLLVPGQSRLVSINNQGAETQIKISMVRYSVEGEELKLFVIDNLNNLLLQNEIDAQRKLVSVLTHEIMNSLSPIISLSETLCDTISCSDEESKMALNVIRNRSAALLTFVENYRKLSRLAKPQFNWIRIGDLFVDLYKLYSNSFIKYEIENTDLILRMDRNQIMQVLINILKNAIEACGEDPAIVVSSKADYPSRLFFISISDNGSGIKPDAREKIFVPFYTTKPEGSGIGLSISCQIVNMHGGELRFDSSDKGTVFTIVLPCIYRE